MVQKNTIANSTAQFKYAYLTPLDDVYLVKRLNCGNKEAR